MALVEKPQYSNYFIDFIAPFNPLTCLLKDRINLTFEGEVDGARPSQTRTPSLAQQDVRSTGAHGEDVGSVG